MVRNPDAVVAPVVATGVSGLLAIGSFFTAIADKFQGQDPGAAFKLAAGYALVTAAAGAVSVAKMRQESQAAAPHHW